mmetsp:Transcript_11188/g.25446  ORF Transcript_11188/g.25446 Transcript_11188/m.25446 type:complete len:2019 (-) Transcript_11188:124-6180(-)
MPGRLRQCTDNVPAQLQPKATVVRQEREEGPVHIQRPAFESHLQQERKVHREIELEALLRHGLPTGSSAEEASWAEEVARRQTAKASRKLGSKQAAKHDAHAGSLTKPCASTSGHTHSKDVDAAEDDSDDLSWASSSDFEDEVYVPHRGDGKPHVKVGLEQISRRMLESHVPAQRRWGQAVQHVEKMAAVRRMKVQAEVAMNNMRTLKLFIKGRTSLYNMEHDVEKHVALTQLGTYQRLVREIEAKHISPPARYNRMLEEKIVPVLHGLQKAMVPVSNTGGPARLVARELEQEEEIGSKNLFWMAERKASMVSVSDEYNGMISEATVRLKSAVSKAGQVVKDHGSKIEELTTEKTRLKKEHDQYMNEMMELDRREKFILGVVQQVEEEERRLEAEKQAKIRHLTDELKSKTRLMQNLERLCQDEDHKGMSLRSKLERKLEEKMLANAHRMIDVRLARQLRERLYKQRKLMHQYVVLCHQILFTENALVESRAQLRDQKVLAQTFHLRFLTIEAKALTMEMRQRVSELSTDGTKLSSAEDDAEEKQEKDVVKTQAGKHGLLRFLSKELEYQVGWLQQKGQPVEATLSTLSVADAPEPTLPQAFTNLLEAAKEELAQDAWEVVDLRLSRRRSSRRASKLLESLPLNVFQQADNMDGRYQPQLNVHLALEGRDRDKSSQEEQVQRAQKKSGRPPPVQDTSFLAACRELASLGELKVGAASFRERWEEWTKKVGLGSLQQGPAITQRMLTLLTDLGEALQLAEDCYYWMSLGARVSGSFNDLLQVPGEMMWLPKYAEFLHERLGILSATEEYIKVARKECGRSTLDKAMQPVLLLLNGLDMLTRKSIRRQAEAWQLRLHAALREHIEHYLAASESLKWFASSSANNKDVLTAINRGLLYTYRALRVPVMRDGASEKRLLLPELDREVWAPLEESMKIKDPEALHGSQLVLGMLLMSTKVLDIGGIPLQDPPAQARPRPVITTDKDYSAEELEALYQKHTQGERPDEWDELRRDSLGGLSPKTPRRKTLRRRGTGGGTKDLAWDALAELPVCRTPGIMTWWRSLLPDARPASLESSASVSSGEGLQSELDKASAEFAEDDAVDQALQGQLQVPSRTPSGGAGSRPASRKSSSRKQDSASPSSRASSGLRGLRRREHLEEGQLRRSLTADEINPRIQSQTGRRRSQRMRSMKSDPTSLASKPSSRATYHDASRESSEPEAEDIIEGCEELEKEDGSRHEDEPEAELEADEDAGAGPAARLTPISVAEDLQRVLSPALVSSRSSSAAGGRASPVSEAPGSPSGMDSALPDSTDFDAPLPPDAPAELQSKADSRSTQRSMSQIDRLSPVTPRARSLHFDLEGAEQEKTKVAREAVRGRMKHHLLARRAVGSGSRSSSAHPQFTATEEEPEESLFVGREAVEVKEWLQKAKSTKFTSIARLRHRSPVSQVDSAGSKDEESLEDLRDEVEGVALMRSLRNAIVSQHGGSAPLDARGALRGIRHTVVDRYADLTKGQHPAEDQSTGSKQSFGKFGLDVKGITMTDTAFPLQEKWKRHKTIATAHPSLDSSEQPVVEDWRELLHRTRPFLLQATTEPALSVEGRLKEKAQRANEKLEIDASQPLEEPHLAEELLDKMQPRLSLTPEAGMDMKTLSSMKQAEIVELSRRISRPRGLATTPDDRDITADFLLDQMLQEHMQGKTRPRTAASELPAVKPSSARIEECHKAEIDAPVDETRIQVDKILAKQKRCTMVSFDGTREAKLPKAVELPPNPSKAATLCLVHNGIMQDLLGNEPPPARQEEAMPTSVTPDNFDDYAAYVLELQQNQRHWIPTLSKSDRKSSPSRTANGAPPTATTHAPSTPSSRGWSASAQTSRVLSPDLRRSHAQREVEYELSGARSQRDPAYRVMPEALQKIEGFPSTASSCGHAAPLSSRGAERVPDRKLTVRRQGRKSPESWRLPGLIEHEVEAAVLRPSGAVIGVPHSKCLGWRPSHNVLHNIGGTSSILSGAKEVASVSIRERTPRREPFVTR